MPEAAEHQHTEETMASLAHAWDAGYEAAFNALQSGLAVILTQRLTTREQIEAAGMKRPLNPYCTHQERT